MVSLGDEEEEEEEEQSILKQLDKENISQVKRIKKRIPYKPSSKELEN